MPPVAVFLPPSITESFEIVLARACDLQDSGKSVFLAYCSGAFRGCVANPYGWASLCEHCTSVTEQAIEAVLPGVPKQCYRRVVGGKKLPVNPVESTENGPHSTILTFYRQNTNKINWRYRNAIFLNGLKKRYKKYEIATYLFAKELIAETRPERIEYFNGRITPTMSISQAAIDSGVKRCAIEVSGYNKSFFLAYDTKVHKLDFLKYRIKNYIPSAEAKLLGITFFENKRSGIKTNDKSYTNHQAKGYFRGTKQKTIAIFLSSTDEFEIFGDEWFTPCSRDPVTFVLSLRKKLPSEYGIIVRMHPNQAGDKTGISEYIKRQLTGRDGITLIKPTDKHSSYELIDLACTVITFGSTVGFEATYWGKPSILAGRCAWESEEVAYVTDSPENAAKLVTSHPLALSKENAIKIAAYYMDKLDETINLSYNHETGLFLARGFNFLKDKRSSVWYKLNRAIDLFLIR